MTLPLQETTKTLDALTCQLNSLSLQCATAIDAAMDAVQVPLSHPPSTSPSH